jgi:hypothetical protein
MPKKDLAAKNEQASSAKGAILCNARMATTQEAKSRCELTAMEDNKRKHIFTLYRNRDGGIYDEMVKKVKIAIETGGMTKAMCLAMRDLMLKK